MFLKARNSSKNNRAKPVDTKVLDQLFLKARSQNGWKNEDISDKIIRSLYELTRMGSTSVNSCPARFIFVKSNEAKERLKPHVFGGNVEKVMTAPVCVIIAHDMEFQEQLPHLFPHKTDIANMFTQDDRLKYETAFRNGSMQGAYLMMAARALGYDYGPISGFSNQGVDKEFFPDGRLKSNYLCNIGIGDETKVYERLPRLDFDKACEII